MLWWPHKLFLCVSWCREWNREGGVGDPDSQKRVLKFTIFTFVMMALASKSESLVTANTSTAALWAGSKYQIECTMCAACDNPCSVPSPPPPPPDSPSPPPPASPSPPPPSPPSSTSNCPPPPSPPSSGSYYYSPPPPSQSNYYYSPPPPGGIIGNYYPPPYKSYPTGPTPPPPNPIVPYFPFYFYSPPPPTGVQSSAEQFRSYMAFLITPVLSICMLLFK